MRLFYELIKSGVSVKRIFIDSEKVKNTGSKRYLQKLFSVSDCDENDRSSDIIQEIENGFLFQFPHLNFRIIGNFSEYTMTMKSNVKVYNQNEVFVDSIDLYKNRDRQNFIYNIMDKFNIRDQLLHFPQKSGHIVKLLFVTPSVTQIDKDLGIPIQNVS